MHNFVHECIEMDLFAVELHRQESATFLANLYRESNSKFSSASGRRLSRIATVLRFLIRVNCREARRALRCASRQTDRHSRRARVVMELLYASRQSASDVLRARLNLLAQFCSRMHRDGPVRSGTPQARIGYFFGPVCIGNPTVNFQVPRGGASTKSRPF